MIMLSGFHATANHVAHQFNLWPYITTLGVVVVEPLRCDASRIVLSRLITHMHCTLKAYKAIGTPLWLYGNVVVVGGQPFGLPIVSIFAHLVKGGVVGPLRCDACRIVLH